MRPPPLAFAATLVAVGLGVGLSTVVLDEPGAATPAAQAPTVVPVTHGVRVCPAPSGIPRRQQTTVAAAVTGAGGGTLRLGAPGAAGRPLALGAGGTAARTYGDPATSAVVATADGPLAAAYEVAQLTRADGGPGRGLAATRCAAPGTSATFVGVGTRVGADPRLYLTNPDDIPALVDLDVVGARGPLPTSAGQGLRLGPHQRVMTRLVGLAPDQDDLAVTVTARTGRVAAALHDARRRGNSPRGVDWVPPSGPAATDLTIPGLYEHPGHVTLSLLAPGATDAAVRVRLVRRDGSFVPTGLDQLRVRAGTLRSVDLSRAVGGQAAAVRLTSDQPVQAGIVTRMVGTGVAEVAYASPVAPVRAALVPLLPVRSGARQVIGVQLAAPRAAAQVRLTPLPGTGPRPRTASPVTVRLRAGTIALADPVRLFGARAPLGVRVEVLAGSGPVVAAAYWFEQGSRGPMLTVLPVAAQGGTLLRPAVRPDPLAGLAQPG